MVSKLFTLVVFVLKPRSQQTTGLESSREDGMHTVSSTELEPFFFSVIFLLLSLNISFRLGPCDIKRRNASGPTLALLGKYN